MKKLILATALTVTLAAPVLAQNLAEQQLRQRQFDNRGDCQSSLSTTRARVRQDVKRGNDTEANQQRFEQARCTENSSGKFVIQFPD